MVKTKFSATFTVAITHKIFYIREYEEKNFISHISHCAPCNHRLWSEQRYEKQCRSFKSLQASQDNDSIAMDIFKKEYEITNMRLSQKKWLLKKNHIEMTQYFDLEKNKKYYCRSKRFKDDNPLLLVE
ncbi:hypothetical protein [Proteiniphilum sp. X52]|uniref:hypothetical protein n=1 Tax=Proteiniphilum sp. X52 TaxID=2382159 RepID=UPI001314B197|nr:hypothetical protein [Proteiniphilum sp. X52]